MEIEIKEDNNQLLLNRRQIKALVSFESATPSRLEIRKKLADMTSKDQKLITISNIDTKFGARQAMIEVHIYTKLEELQKIEPKHILKRHAKGEEKQVAKKAEAKPENQARDMKAEEKPAEEEAE